MTNNIYWTGIRAFVAVAEHGSFTGAAEALGSSKASLSQQVTNLEKNLGIQLLYRTTRQLRLTPQGEGYFKRAQAAVIQLQTAADWATQDAQALSGDIRVNSVGGVIGEELIAPLLIKFQQQHTGINIQLDFSSPKVDLLNSEYDLVVRMGAMPDSTLVARPLKTITTRYVASPEYIKNHEAINQPDDLKNQSLIYGSIREWRFSKGKKISSINAQQGFHISNGRVMREAALAGLGIARLADIYVTEDLNQGRLLELFSDWDINQTPLHLVCPPARYQLNRVRALSDWLINGVAQ